ncbi:MAG: GGDEF domain-containing response regulator [Saccharospirillum sp.]
MVKTKAEQLNELKQHFGRRVMDQARLVISTWHDLEEVLWNNAWLDEFTSQVNKLARLARRYDSARIVTVTQQLQSLLSTVAPGKPPQSQVIAELSQAVQALADSCSRETDTEADQRINNGRRPVYLCGQTVAQSTNLAEQLNFFGIPVQVISDREELQQAVLHRIPAAMIVNVRFDGDGIAAVKAAQKALSKASPVLFQSETEPDIHERLAATRAQGLHFHVGQPDVGLLVKQLSALYTMRPENPYRVLVVDDSKAQSTYAERVLNQAGMITYAINDPLSILEALQQFQPDAILMDMYMPGCTGIELARVLRQQPRYDTLPILYLSAEQDVEKQLDALGQGGDDFLTKPVPRDVLITTVRNRCLRYRGLKQQMIRDSLTGLLDHINTLDALQREVSLAESSAQPLTFAMIDIDRFKAVNDTYGHAVGDSVIRSLALYLRQRFRISDHIGRYGGEEFAIILPNTRLDIAETLLREVATGFARIHHETGRQPINVTFSVGLAQWQPGQQSADISQAADRALYQAKDHGRNRVCVAGKLPTEGAQPSQR